MYALSTTAIVRCDYTLEEICALINKPLSRSSKIITHPHPIYYSDNGYSYLLEKYGKEEKGLHPDEIFDGDGEYRFTPNPSNHTSDGVQGIRLFRDNKKMLKIICEYIQRIKSFSKENDNPALEEITNSVDGILAFEDGGRGGNVVLDKLDEKGGYILISMNPNKGNGIVKPMYYLMLKQNKTHYISAYISKSIIKKEEREKLDLLEGASLNPNATKNQNKEK